MKKVAVLLLILMISTVGMTRSKRTTRKTRTNTSSNNKSSGSLHFKNCTDARNRGYSDIKRGEPGYRSGLDRDKDGVACESR